MHVRYASEAYLLGPAPSSESYLRGDKIIEIALKTGGSDPSRIRFFAPRADFAQAVEDAGLEFIGPRPAAIAAMAINRARTNSS